MPKFLHSERGFISSEDAYEYMCNDSRFRSNKADYIIVPSERADVDLYYSIIHQDACAVHPSYDADECPLHHVTVEIPKGK